MQMLKKISKYLLYFIISFSAIYFLASNWYFIFKKRIVGQVEAVEKVQGVMTVITNSQEPVNPQAFSFSVAIRDLKTQEIHMASSEDRKWAAVQKGNCVVAAFFPYAPWNLSKGTTDHNARLLKNFESCSAVPEMDGFWEGLRFFFLWY